MDIELITLINSFKTTIALNNLLIKEKILRKLEMIHNMHSYGFPLMNYTQATNNKIIQELQHIDKEGDIVKYSRATNNSDTNKLLGDILHNAYQASGYNIILYNVPSHGTTVCGNFIQLDCEAIYDTLVQYAIENTVKSVFQISADTYLIKMNSNDNAIELCNLLNEKLLEGKVIKVEYIEPLSNGIKLVRNKSQSTNGYNVNDIDIDVDDIDVPYKFSKLDNITSDKKEMKDIGKQSYFKWFMDIIYGFIQKIKLIR